MIWQRHLQQTYLALQVAKHRKHDAREFKLAFRHNVKTFDMLGEQPIASTERQTSIETNDGWDQSMETQRHVGM